ncbi:MAG: ATP-binding protein [Bacteroidota bacterium]
MLNQSHQSLIIFIIVVVILLVLFGVFIVTIIYRYQKRQIAYFTEIEELKVTHHNTLLQSQLEVQEQTFQHIAREIHDNIGQKLTLAKLYLNTVAYTDMDNVKLSVNDSLTLITESISSLSDVSKSMGTDIILNNGLVKAIEIELKKLNRTGLYNCTCNVTGREVFFNGNTEIVIFRIVQECINNFIKHAAGKTINIGLDYSNEELSLMITDNGQGFDTNKQATGAGLINIKKRAAILNGSCRIHSSIKGTNITINIPINENTIQANNYTGR